MSSYGENSPRYPSTIEAIVLVVLFIVLQLICGLAVTIFRIPEDTSLMFFLNFIIIPVITGTAVVSYGLWRAERKWNSLAEKTPGSGFSYLAVLIMFIGLSLVLSEIDNVVRHFFPMTDFWIEIFQSIYQADLWLSFIGIAIIPPVIEEMVFRGIILKGFLKRYSPTIAIGLSSVLFALMHINLWQIVTALIAGFFLGWIYYKTSSLFLVIFAHALVNSISILGSKYTTIQGFSDTSPFQPYWLNLLGIALLILGLLLFSFSVAREKNLNYD